MSDESEDDVWAAPAPQVPDSDEEKWAAPASQLCIYDQTPPQIHTHPQSPPTFLSTSTSTITNLKSPQTQRDPIIYGHHRNQNVNTRLSLSYHQLLPTVINETNMCRLFQSNNISFDIRLEHKIVRNQSMSSKLMNFFYFC